MWRWGWNLAHFSIVQLRHTMCPNGVSWEHGKATGATMGGSARAKGGTHATHTSYRLDNLRRGPGHDCIRRAPIGSVANERPLPRSGSGGARSEFLEVS